MAEAAPDRGPMSADDCKAAGNACLKAKDLDGAISWYTTAIEKNPAGHVYYSNRSAAYLAKGEHEKALEDGNACIEAKSDWPKGYNRAGCALHALKRYDEAITTFKRGLIVSPGHALLVGPLKEAQAAQAAAAGGQKKMPNPFGPDMWAKLQSNPTTAQWLQDPGYVQNLNTLASNPQIVQNPQMIQQLGDQRLLQTFLFLMGLPLNMGQAGGPGYTGPPPEKRPKPAAKKEPEPEPEPETEEQKAAREIREAGTALKDAGNALFKEKRYAEAIAKYEEAEAADPTLMTYRTNVASCYHAMKDYDKCLAACERAVALGREHMNPYPLIAKALERAANAHYKKEDIAQGIVYLEKAQMEIHDDKRHTKLKKWKKKLKEVEAAAYLDPEKALACKEEGNKLFAAKDFRGAIERYTEAIKRDPSNPAYWCNRCAAHQKTLNMNDAVKDANEAIKRDPTYVKAYSRRATCEYFTKEYHKALASYQKILDIDPDHAEAQKGLQRVARVIESNMQSGKVDPEQRARAMADPKIKAILEDQYMQTVLREMQTDPAAFQGYMKQPDVAEKIQTLIQAGILQVGSGPRK